MDRKVDPTPQSHASSVKEAGSRRPYTAPRLVEYGSIAKLTQSQGSTLPEGLRPQMQPCL